MWGAEVSTRLRKPGGGSRRAPGAGGDTGGAGLPQPEADPPPRAGSGSPAPVLVGVQCSETKSMAKETTGTDPRKVGRVHVILA